METTDLSLADHELHNLLSQASNSTLDNSNNLFGNNRGGSLELPCKHTSPSQNGRQHLQHTFTPVYINANTHLLIGVEVCCNSLVGRQLSPKCPLCCPTTSTHKYDEGEKLKVDWNRSSSGIIIGDLNSVRSPKHLVSTISGLGSLTEQQSHSPLTCSNSQPANDVPQDLSGSLNSTSKCSSSLVQYEHEQPVEKSLSSTFHSSKNSFVSLIPDPMTTVSDSVGRHPSNHQHRIEHVAAQLDLLEVNQQPSRQQFYQKSEQPISTGCKRDRLVSGLSAGDEAEEGQAKHSTSPIHLHRRARNANSCSSVSVFDMKAPMTSQVNTGSFNRVTGLPLSSSPVPMRRSVSGRFDFDPNVVRSHHSDRLVQSNTVSPTNCSTPQPSSDSSNCQPVLGGKRRRQRRPASLQLSTASVTGACCGSAPLSSAPPPSATKSETSQCQLSRSTSRSLLVNFEESMLNGCITPAGQIDGFTIELCASGSFLSPHTRLPLVVYFFDLADDQSPSPYLGLVDLAKQLPSRKGYRVPKKGSIQLTLFNPNGSVIKVFVVLHDLVDMPPNSLTFIRQRIVGSTSRDILLQSAKTTTYCPNRPTTQQLRYLVHLSLTHLTYTFPLLDSSPPTFKVPYNTVGQTLPSYQHPSHFYS